MPTLSVPVRQWSTHRSTLENSYAEHPTRLPVPNPTQSFWINTPDSNPLADEGSQGPLIQDADICIIGSGITGVSAAYHLSKELQAKAMMGSDADLAKKVVILEARDFCSGATGRNGGHLRASAFESFTRLSKLYGPSEALKCLTIESHTVAEILKILEEEDLADAVDLVQGGHVRLFCTDEDARDAKADFGAARDAGADTSKVEWLNKEEVEETYDIAYPAVRYPGTNLWPLKLVTQLFFLAKKSPSISLTLHTRTPVTSIIPTSSSSPRRWTLTTPRGSISCTYIIHASNGYASYLLPHLHGPNGIIPTRGQVIALRSNASSSKLTKVGWGANGGFEYWFPRPVKKCLEGRREKEENPLVILGGGREVTSPKFELYVDDDSVVNGDVGRALREFLPGLFPGMYVKGREPEMEWTGIMGYTKTGDPFVGPVLEPKSSTKKYEGQFIAAGYAGHGMPRAFSCAQVAVSMVLADVDGIPWSAPEWLPKHYLTFQN